MAGLPPSRRARLTGVGDTPFGEIRGSSVLGLHSQAARAALADAGLAPGDVDGVLCAYSLVEPHLMLSSVVAEYLGIPEAICRRPPTSDTYSAHSTQEEFFFRLPFATMDLLWYAMEHEAPISEVAQVMGLTPVQVQRAFEDFRRKQRTTEYLRMRPISIGDTLPL